jgi:putative redox protein
MRTKVEFTSKGNTLAGLLQTPDSAVRCYALFAHCFTCSKDILAASRIATALNLRGIAVLRFDFTGLGNSDGDFANTNFSSNTQDLLAAVEFLRQHYQAPALLIGHSLGGAAVLAVAKKVPEATAVVTIGTPWEPARIMHNFAASIDEINTRGEAEITLGQGQFRIKKQFIDDLQSQGVGHIGKLRKALLVMHSPQDETVPLQEAEKIYLEAKHPKSFISLDQADHLLSKKRDSDYVAEVIAGWASRYLPESPHYSMAVSKGHVLVEEKNQKFTQHVSTDSHYWLADEPTAFGGDNAGPDPYEHLLAALGACTSMTLRLYANRKKLSLDNVQVELNHQRCHEKDSEGCEQSGGALETISRKIRIEGDLTPQQRQRLLEIADRCPVHKTLHRPLRVVTEPMESD